MRILEKTYTIHAPLEVVWKALTDAKTIEAWSGSPAIMDDKVETEFSLWNGDIYGKNLEVMENDELVQEWSSKGWPKPSKVTFTLSHSNERTTIQLLHEDIPDDEYENIDEGWTEYYMDPIKEYVETEIG